MKFYKANDFTGTTAWDAVDIAEIEDATIKLHWADKPYIWHVNDGDEVLVVLDGVVDMHYKNNGTEYVEHMNVGDIFHAKNGDAHVAHPVGEARMLVVEKKGSI